MPLPSQESLEEAYVHLNTQLLLYLQCRNTDAALRTAEVIRDMLTSSDTAGQQSSTPATGSGPSSLSSGYDLFHGSPAEQLLQLREQLKMLASAESRQTHESNPSETRTSEPTSPESSGSGTNGDNEEEEDEEEEDEDESELYSDSLDSDSDEREESSMTGSSSSSSNQDRQHQRQQAASHLITEALKAWKHSFPKPNSSSPTHAGSALASAAAEAATTSSLKAPAKPRASRPPEPPRRPQLPHQRVNGKNKKNAPPPDQTRDASAKPQILTPRAPPPEEAPVNDMGDDSRDTEAEEVWGRMQAEVAEEMRRLALVRKNR